MGKMQRDKGRRGQREAILVLELLGFSVQELNSGTKSADLIATISNSIYLVEVKNQKVLNIPVFIKQAKANAKEHKNAKWLLMCRLDGGYGWLLIHENATFAFNQNQLKEVLHEIKEPNIIA
ncbi:MAG: hypothetical protein ACFFDN_00745 [Candidatus Hodarchaeota archaeon]